MIHGIKVNTPTAYKYAEGIQVFNGAWKNKFTRILTSLIDTPPIREVLTTIKTDG